MKIEIVDTLVEEVNETFEKYYGWDGTVEEWESWIHDLIEEIMKEFRYM